MTIPYTRHFAYLSHLYSAHIEQLTLSGHVLVDIRQSGCSYSFEV